MEFKEAIPHAKELLGDDTTQLFINQLLVAFVLKQGGKIEIPVSDVDATGDFIMNMEVDQHRQLFILQTRRKQ